MEAGKICLRPVRAEDAAAMLEYLRQIGGESDNLTFGAEGLPLTVEQEARRLLAAQNDPCQVMLAAVCGEEIVGVCGLSRTPRARLMHRAAVDVSVRRAYWNRGIATLLLKQLLAQGEAAGVTVFALEVLADNAPAIHLYEKLGFHTVGRMERFFRMPDGRYRAALAMERLV